MYDYLSEILSVCVCILTFKTITIGRTLIARPSGRERTNSVSKCTCKYDTNVMSNAVRKARQFVKVKKKSTEQFGKKLHVELFVVYEKFQQQLNG